MISRFLAGLFLLLSAALQAIAVAEGKEPDRFRPLSAAPQATWSTEGAATYQPAGVTMPCMMPDEAAHFGESWSCGAGTVCTPLAGASNGRFTLAQCLLPPKSEEMFSGHPCLTGEIATNQSQPFNDRMKLTGQFAAFDKNISRTGYTCRPPEIGVPGGLAYRACDDKDRSFADFKPGQKMPREICGLAGGKKFDLCVATNNFDQCLGGAVVRGNRPSCSPTVSAARTICARNFRRTRRASRRSRASVSARRPISSSRCASTTTPPLGASRREPDTDGTRVNRVTPI